VTIHLAQINEKKQLTANWDCSAHWV